MRLVGDLLECIDAPTELRRRVQIYHDLKFASHQGLAAALISELPAKLQVAVLKQKYGAWISRVAFFRDLDDLTLVEVCSGIETMFVMAGDHICEAEDIGRELLILVKGNARQEEGPQIPVAETCARSSA